MSRVQKLLEEAIDVFGVNDVVTVMLSQKRDMEVVNEQKKKYEEWNAKNKSKIAG